MQAIWCILIWFAEYWGIAIILKLGYEEKSCIHPGTFRELLITTGWAGASCLLLCAYSCVIYPCNLHFKSILLSALLCTLPRSCFPFPLLLHYSKTDFSVVLYYKRPLEIIGENVQIFDILPSSCTLWYHMMLRGILHDITYCQFIFTAKRFYLMPFL